MKLLMSIVFLLMLAAPLYAAENYSPEEAALKRAIDHSPTSPDLHEDLGGFYLQQARYAEAIAQFRTALSLRPHEITTCYNLGFCLEQLGKYEQAIRYYAEALRWSSYEISFRLGMCYHHLYRDKEAVPYFKNVAEIQETPAVHYALALSLAGANHYRSALTELRLARNSDPRFKAGEVYFSSPYASDEIQEQWLQDERKQWLEAASACLLTVGWGAFFFMRVKFLRRKPAWRAWEVKQVT